MAATALECLASVVPRHPKMRDRSGGFISLSDVILTTPGFISLSADDKHPEWLTLPTDVILTTPSFILSLNRCHSDDPR